ncbi:hypothetical protein ACMD2_21934, partial [Ananas comosus]
QEVISEDNGAELFGACSIKGDQLRKLWIGPQLKLGGGVDAVEKFMCCELKRKLWKLSISCGTLKLSLVNWAAELEKVPAVAVAEQEAWAIRIERKSEI